MRSPSRAPEPPDPGALPPDPSPEPHPGPLPPEPFDPNPIAAAGGRRPPAARVG